MLIKKASLVKGISKGSGLSLVKKILNEGYQILAPTLILAFLILLSLNAKAQKTIDSAAIVTSIFPRGEKVTSGNNFNGEVWLNRFISPGDSLDCIVALVTFQPGVRTNWHIHPGGQILIVTQGVGYYQEKGKPRQIIRKGNIIKCSPEVQHWHGASPDSEFAHLVTEEEYNSLK